MFRPSRLGIGLAATIVAGGLFTGGGVASATPTAGCDQAKAALTRAQAGKDQEAITKAQALVDASCATTAPTSNPSPGDPPDGGGGSSPTEDPGRPGHGRPGDENPGGHGGHGGGGGHDGDDHQGPGEAEGPAAGLDCSEFTSQAEAQKYYFYSLPKDREVRKARLDRDGDGQACNSLEDVGGDPSTLPVKIDSSTVVNQTDDDDSAAKVSGSQVKDVPQGSVDTGSAQ